MKIYKYILGALLLSGLALPLTNVRAQDVHLKCLEWNVKALEFYNNSNVSKEIGRFVTLIREQNAEIVFFNEFETLSGAMFLKEKANEFAKELGMYSFFIHSYNKRGNDGYYGNVILSKYPIVNTGRVLLGMYEGADQRSVGWADILVPTDSKPEGVKVRIVCTHLDAFGGNVTCLEQAKGGAGVCRETGCGCRYSRAAGGRYELRSFLHCDCGICEIGRPALQQRRDLRTKQQTRLPDRLPETEMDLYGL